MGKHRFLDDFKKCSDKAANSAVDTLVGELPQGADKQKCALRLIERIKPVYTDYEKAFREKVSNTRALKGAKFGAPAGAVMGAGLTLAANAASFIDAGAVGGPVGVAGAAALVWAGGPGRLDPRFGRPRSASESGLPGVFVPGNRCSGRW